MKSADLVKQRQKLGLTQETMAETIGVGRRSWIRYEMGETPIPKMLELAMLYLLSQPSGRRG